VGTPATPGSAPARRRSTRWSSACAAAEPVPRPSGIPGSLAAVGQGGMPPPPPGREVAPSTSAGIGQGGRIPSRRQAGRPCPRRRRAGGSLPLPPPPSNREVVSPVVSAGSGRR
jgi:hypothetical protein